MKRVIRYEVMTSQNIIRLAQLKTTKKSGGKGVFKILTFFADEKMMDCHQIPFINRKWFL